MSKKIDFQQQLSQTFASALGLDAAEFGAVNGSDADFWEKHDKARHGGHFDPERQTCKPREEAQAAEEEREKADERDDFESSDISDKQDIRARKKAPNGQPSNLDDGLWELVRSPEFKEWFGDWENDPENASKCVDENGEPLVVWHAGTFGNDGNSEPDTKDGMHFGTLSAAVDRATREHYIIICTGGGFKWGYYNDENGRGYDAPDSFSKETFPTKEEALKDAFYDYTNHEAGKQYYDRTDSLMPYFLNWRCKNPEDFTFEWDDPPKSEMNDRAQWTNQPVPNIIRYRNAEEDRGSYSYKVFSPELIIRAEGAAMGRIERGKNNQDSTDNRMVEFRDLLAKKFPNKDATSIISELGKIKSAKEQKAYLRRVLRGNPA